MREIRRRRKHTSEPGERERSEDLGLVIVHFWGVQYFWGSAGVLPNFPGDPFEGAAFEGGHTVLSEVWGSEYNQHLVHGACVEIDFEDELSGLEVPEYSFPVLGSRCKQGSIQGQS